jgi:hypothetical protein
MSCREWAARPPPTFRVGLASPGGSRGVREPYHKAGAARLADPPEPPEMVRVYRSSVSIASRTRPKKVMTRAG